MRYTILLCTAAFVACDTRSRDAVIMDTALGSVGSDTANRDSGVAHYGTASDSARGDTGAVTMYPSEPRIGGVIVATVAGDSAAAARCTWKGDVIPCHATQSGVRVFVPLPVEDSAGTYKLTINTPNAEITRQITVAAHDFGRELILLDDSLYALVQQRSEIARDSRSVRQVLGRVSNEQRWSGAWREPTRERETTSEYGVAHFYAPASTSTRTIALGDSLQVRGAFGTDTGSTRNELPSWRHAGVDIARSRGTVVNAPAGGVVADVGRYTLMGRSVFIDHGLGVYTAYFHLDTALVRRGDVVEGGAPIGRVGRTGLATGPHQHYGVYVNGHAVDPALWHEAVSWMDRTRTMAQRSGTRRDSVRP